MNPFSPFIFIFEEVLSRPLLNLLVFFYQLPYVDFGMAILILTFLLRIVLWPLNSKAIVQQRELQEKTQGIQEEMKEIKEKYRDNPAQQNAEIMKIWKKKKFNPFASFVPMIIQIIILIALYQVLRHVLLPDGLNLLYGFVSNPGEINPMFLGIVDLSKASIVLAVLTGISQYFYSKMTFSFKPKSQKKKKPRYQKGKEQKEAGKDKMEDMQKKMQKVMKTQMIYFMPVFTVFICMALPAALALYWLFSTVVGVFQQKMIYKKIEAND